MILPNCIDWDVWIAWGCQKDAWSSGSRGFIKVWRGSKILQEAEYACTNFSDF